MNFHHRSFQKPDLFPQGVEWIFRKKDAWERMGKVPLKRVTGEGIPNHTLAGAWKGAKGSKFAWAYGRASSKPGRRRIRNGPSAAISQLGFGYVVGPLQSPTFHCDSCAERFPERFPSAEIQIHENYSWSVLASFLLTP